MPPKKRQAASAKEAPPAKKARRSKLAQENNITADDEAEIKGAWQMFSQADVENYEDEKEGVMETDKVRFAFRALGIAGRNDAELKELIEILDPESEGYATYPHFLEVCALKINDRTDEAKLEEVNAAFKLFTNGADRPIALQDLRAVAKTLKENVGDDVLKAMILEANGGAGLTKGVDAEQFRAIMTRAGIF